MSVKGDARSYGSLAVAFHWISAAAILTLLLLGFLAASTADQSIKATLLRIHVPLGILTLVLTLARIGWWLFDKRPGDPAGQPRWQAFAAHAVHALLYLLTLIMGASGIGLMILSGAGAILFFGAQGSLPRFEDLKPMIVHGGGAFAIVALLCVHVGAALYHQLFVRDRLLARMKVGAPTPR